MLENFSLNYFEIWNSNQIVRVLVSLNTHLNFYRSVLILPVRYLRILVVIFVILSAVIGLGIQEVTQPKSTISESTKIVEAGGKIIDVEVYDEVQTVVDSEDFTELLNEFVTNNPPIQTHDDVEVKDQMDLGFQEFLHSGEH